MDYGAYARTQQEHEARESRKRPGQRFCDEVGWQITMNGYKEMRRPDKVTFTGGSIIRTYTQVFDVWYKNERTGEHILVEFNCISGGTIKRHVKVTSSPGTSFNSVMLHIDSDNFSDVRHFGTNKDAASYIINAARN